MITEPICAEQTAIEEPSGGVVASQASADLGSIEFRVIRSGAPARRMRLNSTRCTLGSGEGCTVRLNDPSLRPMHAVILRDANRVLMRAYTVPIEVNGYLTGETFLHLGDTFTLGTYHFELICSPDNAKTSLPGDQHAYMVSAPSHAHSPAAHNETANEHRRDVSPAGPISGRGRLSFLGGESYVSEAFQPLLARPLGLPTQKDSSTRINQRAEADQLRREVDAWRKREQHWKDQESQTRIELADAVARFHQSQERATEASEAVSQMRRRMSQLTEELESLSNDSIEFRQQAAERQERLRQAADTASDARDSALRLRDEAARQLEEVTRTRDDVTSQRDDALRQRDEATQKYNQLATANAEIARERDTTRQALNQSSEELEQARAALQQSRSDYEQARLELERSQQSGNQVNQQAADTAVALSQTRQQIDSLRDELIAASEELQLARAEVAAAYARIEDLSIEVNRYRDRLAIGDQSATQQCIHYESQLEELRREVKRLESDCASAREHASAAANDRQLADSLQSRLTMTESYRNSDRLSWEQEAAVLQETIQQLSVELAAATGRLSQTQSDHEVTQSELDDAYGRLTVARRELSARPTSQQWDELQRQLAETEQQLDETEKQLCLLRRDYDELLGRQPSKSDIDFQTPPSQGLIVSASQAAVGNPETSSVLDDPMTQPGVDSVSQQDAETGDHGWPTYSATIGHTDQPALASDPFAENSAAAESTNLLVPSGSLFNSPLNPVDQTESEIVSTDTDRLSQRELNEKQTLGLLARELIAKLDEDKTPSSQSDDSDCVSEFDSGEISSDWNPVQTPAVWDLPASYGSSDSASSDFDEFESSPHSDEQSSEHTFMMGDADIDRYVSSRADEDEPVVPDDAYRSPWTSTDASEEDKDSGTRILDFPHPIQDITEHKDLTVAKPDLSPGPTIARQSPVPLAPVNPDDDSIEAYMNRLLQRVQGHSGAPAEPVAAKSAGSNIAVDTSPKHSVSEDEVGKLSETLTVTKTVEVIDANTPLVPRSQAPEDAGNLAAMRELANATANSAISISVRSQATQLKSKAVIDLMQASVVLVCAFAFFTCRQKIPNLKYVWYTAAGLAAALSIFFILDMLRKLSAAKATYDRADVHGAGKVSAKE